MAFRQYTSCVDHTNYVGLFAGNDGLVLSVIAGIIYLLGLIAAFFYAPLIYAAIAALVFLITFLVWWLYGRLICLSDEEQCIIGVALGRPTSNPQKKGGDDDASFNVALARSTIDLLAEKDPSSDDPFSTRLPEPKEHYWDNPLQGKIIKPHPNVAAVDLGYVSDTEHARYLKSIHCEFEGSGIRNLLIWANGVLAILILAAVLSSYPIAALILAILALLLTLILGGIAITAPLNPGDPQDVLPNMGEIESGKIVVIKGNWVYDSLHDGWNEIHAIHACQIIGEIPDGKTWPAEIDTPPEFTDKLGLDTDVKVERAIGVWCLAIKQAEDAEGGGNRDDPAQNWVVHPLIDGCKTNIIL